MPPDATYLVQNKLTEACAPHTRTDGGYFGQTAPHTPVEFRANLIDILSGFKPNSWDLDSITKTILIDNGVLAYINTYSVWVSMPLSVDAPKEVQEWQTEARKG